MPTRLRPAYILELAAPGLICLVAAAISLNVYGYAQRTARARETLYLQQRTLQRQWLQTNDERQQLLSWLHGLQTQYAQASMDGFTAELQRTSAPSPHLLSCSSQASGSASGTGGPVQKYLLAGSSNALIHSLGGAQLKNRTVDPVSWELKRSAHQEQLELELQVTLLAAPQIDPKLPRPLLPSKLEEPSIPRSVELLASTELDAFGLNADGSPLPPTGQSALVQPKPVLRLEGVGRLLALQGVLPGAEAIINSELLHPGDRVATRLDGETIQLQVREIGESQVLVGWDRSNETYLLKFATEHGKLAPANGEVNPFRADEIVLHQTSRPGNGTSRSPSIPTAPSSNPSLARAP